MSLLEYQNTKNWSEEGSMINIVSDLNGEEIVETFYEKKLRETNQSKFRVEKVIKRKCDKIYLKWKDYDSSFNSCVDKKDIV